MSSLTLGTVILFLALAPGFVALSAFYAFGRVPRRAYGASPTIELGAMTTVALVAHLVFGGVFTLALAPLVFEPGVIAGLVGLLLDQVAGRPPNGSVPGRQEYFAVAGYVVFVCAAAGLAGRLLVRAVESGRWIFCDLAETLTDGLYWEAFVRPDGRMGPIFVSVLTNLSQDGAWVTYAGVLEAISRRGPDWIEYLVLTSVSRFRTTMDGVPVAVPGGQGDPGGWRDDEDLPRSRLVLPRTAIVDVVFRPIPVLVGDGRPPRIPPLIRLIGRRGRGLRGGPPANSAGTDASP